ncbi:cg30 [Mamestra brassicae multiple nucleopolyhedrovirus]|uniref:Cg30 n=1 Tax=Mamestra brassicae nuclear polyhedrosis virus TaxID=78219 RepID=I3XMA8_NPVMB|nr:cg30 [Mamestra brassicae multiple nucleopolyhedrovirus]AFL64941.1 cg30 [Mamestra brassicae multiple nucleopolyhedrovirus]WRQ96664.1 cg30 [Mamestra configurata nucleopolyhedrovirus B]WRQ96825.1 cg30 [Mamestra configurata nucleopolyhedrovirus B]WRQ96987.1 cg30 [Mamestra configurata nucleopolyhedrovirus B]
MKSVTIQCNICLEQVVVKKPDDEDFMYIVPLLTLTACNHHYCVDCLKKLQIHTAEKLKITEEKNNRIHCATCRKYSNRLHATCIMNNNMFMINISPANIKLYSTSSVNLHLVEYINTYYSTCVMPNESLKNEDQIKSATQSQLNKLNKNYNETLKIFEKLKDDVRTLENNLTLLTDSIESKKSTRDALNYNIFDKRQELDKLKWEITQASVKLAKIKQNVHKTAEMSQTTSIEKFTKPIYKRQLREGKEETTIEVIDLTDDSQDNVPNTKKMRI